MGTVIVKCLERDLILIRKNGNHLASTWPHLIRFGLTVLIKVIVKYKANKIIKWTFT